MLYNYYVVVNNPSYKEEVHQELSSPTGSNPIPNRTVDCVDPMLDSEYNGIFQLTEEEADLLATDLRILDVHRIPEEVGNIPGLLGARSGVFDKSSTNSFSYKNWALSRCINYIDNFGNATSVSTPYTYNLNGEGVDVIIIDSGVEPNHPEFAYNEDGTGGSRVVDHDWTQYKDSFGNSLIPALTGGFMGDCDGHGTNVASIVAGNTNGWASKAMIYTLRLVPPKTGTPRSIYDNRVLSTITSEVDMYRAIRMFHLAKSIDPITGCRRPTVINGSYAYYTLYSSIGSITYRGVSHTTSVTSSAYGTMGTSQGNSGNTHGNRIYATEVEIQSCIDAGIIIVAAAGNDYHKIDVLGGLDYNNYWSPSGSPSTKNYYHRGATPGSSPGVICVGAISSTLPEHKTNFSCTGPRVDIFSPGYLIMGGYANKAYIAAAIADPRRSGYYLNKVSGTSQASPQVAGIIACIVQARPWMTAAEVLEFLKRESIKGVLDETFYGGVGYTQLAGLQGANNYLVYLPFNSPIQLSISG